MDDITAADWAAYADWLKRGGPHAHPNLYEFARSSETAARERAERVVTALSEVFAVAQHDPRFKLASN